MNHSTFSEPELQQKQRPFDLISQPVSDFMAIQSSSGILLGICTIVALGFANSSWAEAYAHFWHTPIALTVGSFHLEHSLLHWVNDGLMAIFFFVIGLEIKREFVFGELSDPKKVVLPVAAAVGGAVLPAVIYFMLQGSGPGVHGWAIPMATDIAFVVGFLALLGSRVPRGLTVMLLTLAIVDDLLAIVVIALFYSSSLNWLALLGAAISVLFMHIMRRLEIRSVGAYWVAGIVIWLFTLKSGIHPTIAGVVLGLMTPSEVWIKPFEFRKTIDAIRRRLHEGVTGEDESNLIKHTAHTAVESISPLERLEHDLHPWVSFVIMPIFALGNAAVPISAESMASPVAFAVALGLIFGKPFGIFITSYLTVKLGYAALPTGVRWPVLFAAACLAGIGFTMSLFVAGLSFSGPILDAAKGGVLMGSGLSAVLGLGLLLILLSKQNTGET